MTSSTSTSNVQNDLGSTRWFKKFQENLAQEAATYTQTSHDLKEVDKKMEKSATLIETEMVKLSKLKKEAGVLREKLVKKEKNGRDNQEMMRHLNLYLRWLVYILSHEGSEVTEIRSIVTQTKSLIKVTFNSLKPHMVTMETDDIVMETGGVTEMDILKDKLLFVLELPFKDSSSSTVATTPTSPEVKEATDLLTDFLKDQGKRIKFFSMLLANAKGPTNGNGGGGNLKAICFAQIPPPPPSSPSPSSAEKTKEQLKLEKRAMGGNQNGTDNTQNHDKKKKSKRPKIKIIANHSSSAEDAVSVVTSDLGQSMNTKKVCLRSQDTVMSPGQKLQASGGRDGHCGGSGGGGAGSPSFGLNGSGGIIKIEKMSPKKIKLCANFDH